MAETATIRGNVTLGEHVSVWFGAVIRGDVAPIAIGARTNVQDGAIIHVASGVACMIGQDVTIGHGAIVHACTIEDGALIAMGAIVLDGARVGHGALVGAGALVPPGMEIPPGTLALGVPARIVGPLTGERQAYLSEAAARYVKLKEAYRDGTY